jgi:hypothetical protein
MAFQGGSGYGDTTGAAEALATGDEVLLAAALGGAASTDAEPGGENTAAGDGAGGGVVGPLPQPRQESPKIAIRGRASTVARG